MGRVEGGEEVTFSTVHLSEVVNIIETRLDVEKSLGFLAWAVTSGNVKICPVTVRDYASAIPLARDNYISANDALAYVIMKADGIDEIYSFDKHFDRFKDIVRLPGGNTF